MLRAALEGQLRRLRERGFQVRPLVFDPPAAEEEVAAVERALGHPLPPSFREALLTISARVEYAWFTPEGFRFPPPFEGLFCGRLQWALADLVLLNQVKDSAIRNVFPNPQDPYDAVWHGKLAFYDVGDGDLIALDLNPASYGQVVYLSHCDSHGHGYVLAESFSRLLERWVPLACVGGDDFQWLPFTSGKTAGLDPGCANAQAWRALLGLDG